jgi:hypothetical protein
MTDKSQLELLFDAGETIISDICTNGESIINQRQLINAKTKFLIELGKARRDVKDKRTILKAKIKNEVARLMAEGQKKTPAGEEADDRSREERHELEKMDSDLEIMLLLAHNRSYHMRASEISLNKVGVGEKDETFTQ